MVAESIGRRAVLVGEVKLRAKQADVDKLIHRPLPPVDTRREVVRALFARDVRGLRAKGVLLVGAREVFR